MITPAHLQLMARYNRWQNQSIYRAAATLSDQQRKADRGAFFGSLHGTLCHILFGDQIWMHRFAGTPAPRGSSIKESATAISEWNELVRERVTFDEVIIDWADRLGPNWLEGTTTWASMAVGREITRGNWLLATQLFNHQTHHRGQAHCLLTQYGAKPDDTDIPFMPGLD